MPVLLCQYSAVIDERHGLLHTLLKRQLKLGFEIQNSPDILLLKVPPKLTDA